MNVLQSQAGTYSSPHWTEGCYIMDAQALLVHTHTTDELLLIFEEKGKKILSKCH